jgi:hypothetical protein
MFKFAEHDRRRAPNFMPIAVIVWDFYANALKVTIFNVSIVFIDEAMQSERENFGDFMRIGRKIGFAIQPADGRIDVEVTGRDIYFRQSP